MSRILDRIKDARLLEGLRLARVDFRPIWQSVQHDLAGLIAVVDDHDLDIALPHPLGDSLNDLFGRGGGEVYWLLSHTEDSSFRSMGNGWKYTLPEL